MDTHPADLWEVHIRIPNGGPIALSCKRGGERLTDGVVHLSTPSAALALIEQLLATFSQGDNLFITARTHDSTMSMWSTCSRSAGLYWCAAALGQLWMPVTAELPSLSGKRRNVQPAS